MLTEIRPAGMSYQRHLKQLKKEYSTSDSIDHYKQCKVFKSESQKLTHLNSLDLIAHLYLYISRNSICINTKPKLVTLSKLLIEYQGRTIIILCLVHLTATGLL